MINMVIVLKYGKNYDKYGNNSLKNGIGSIKNSLRFCQ